MNKNIKPIPTEYNGTVFRSRLEAQWAVFFDACKIEWIYEPEGIENEKGERYLPDFYLPELEAHAEVKAERPGFEKEILKIRNFIQWGGPIKKVIILSSIPDPKSKGMPHFPAYYYSTRDAGSVEEGWWFFVGGGDKACGNISSANYRPPLIGEWIPEGARFSILPVSDLELRSNLSHKYEYDDDFDFCMKNYNSPVFEAFEKARSHKWNPPEVKR